MSNKPRTEEQKLRRKYLSLCKKKGIKPMLVEDWRDEVMKKLDNTVVKHEKKSAKKVAKPADRKGVPIHIVHAGDIVKFEGFTNQRVLDFAVRLLCIAWKDVVNDIASKCKCGKKCAKKSTKK